MSLCDVTDDMAYGYVLCCDHFWQKWAKSKWCTFWDNQMFEKSEIKNDMACGYVLRAVKTN